MHTYDSGHTCRQTHDHTLTVEKYWKRTNAERRNTRNDTNVCSNASHFL